MAWTAPADKSTGDIITAAIWNNLLGASGNLADYTLGGIVTTAGDLGYGTGANAVSRLGIGSASNVLKTNSGATAPEWGTIAKSEITGWGNDKSLFTNSSGALTEVALGASGTVFKSAGATADPTWSTVTATEIDGGNDKMLYTDNSGNVTELALGTSGQILQANGATSAPSFATNAPAASAITGWGNDKILYTGNSGTLTELALGSSGQVLQSNGATSAPSFATAGSGAWEVVGSNTSEVSLTGGTESIMLTISGLSITKPFYVYCRWRAVDTTGSSKSFQWGYTTSAGTTKAGAANDYNMGFVYTAGGVTTGMGYAFGFPNFVATYSIAGADWWGNRQGNTLTGQVVGPINANSSGSGGNSLGTTSPITAIVIYGQPNSSGTLYVRDTYVLEQQ